MTVRDDAVTVAATSRDESRVFIPCGDELLSAVFTRPTVEANGMAVIFYAGRWSVTSIGRSRLFVDVARRLAGLGYHCLRLDYLGLGESTGTERPWRLERPFQEEPDAAVRWLGQQGLADIVVMGTCGGARLALDSTRRIGRLVGAALLSPPVRDYQKGDRTATLPATEFVKRAASRRVLAGLRDPRVRRRYAFHLREKLKRMLGRPGASGGAAGAGEFQWVTPNILDPLQELAQRGVPVLFFFGAEDAAYEEFTRGRSGRLGKILEKAGRLIEVVVVDGKFHGLPQSDVARLSGDAIVRWLAVPGAGRRSPGG